MAVRRYSRSPVLAGGFQYGSTIGLRIIYDAAVAGTLAHEVHVIQDGERLDTLAGERYGDGRLWWVIAAASGIGWGLQVPPGTRLRIPTQISQVEALVG